MSQASRYGAEAPPRSVLPPRPKNTKNPPGLTVIYEPKNCKPIVDIVFIHGLGGSSHYTWSYRKDSDFFWPQWLHSESGLSEARISTFGYNSSFHPAFTKNFSCINDFSRQLLFQMKFAADEYRGETSFGQVRSYSFSSSLDELQRSHPKQSSSSFS